MPLVARDFNSMSESERQAKTAHTVTVAVSSDQRRSTVAVSLSRLQQYERVRATGEDRSYCYLYITVAVSSDQRRSTVAVAQDCNSMREQYERQAKTATDQDVATSR